MMEVLFQKLIIPSWEIFLFKPLHPPHLFQNSS